MSDYKLRHLIEGCLSQVLLEIAYSYPEELNVFDFDDTLVATEGTIHLINLETDERRELHPHEFHEYRLKPHEHFDLSDFERLKNPVSLPHLQKMKSDYQRLGPHGVSVCTARADAAPVMEFMESQGMPGIEIVAVGDASPTGDVGAINPARKKAYLKSKILERGLRTLRFYDDNIGNVMAARSLASVFPDVTIEVEHVNKP